MTTAEFRGFVRDELTRQGKSMRDTSRIAAALGYELAIVPEWVRRAQEKRLPAKVGLR